MELLSSPSSGKPQEMWQQAVEQIKSQFQYTSPLSRKPYWHVYNSPVRQERGSNNSYDGFFRPIFPDGIRSLHDHVNSFQQIHERKPAWLEVMGSTYPLAELGVPGLAIEHIPQEYRSILQTKASDRVTVNCDLMNIHNLTVLLPQAMAMINGALPGFDFVTWKGEGGLQKVFKFLPPTLLYLDIFYKMLNPGGRGYFQLPADRTDVCTILSTRAKSHVEKLTVVYAESRQSFQKNALRIDKLASDAPSLFEVFYG